jgi:hypothetical protein
MKNDILNTLSSELRKMPYCVPEGYFDTLKRDLQRTGKTYSSERRILSKVASYSSIAAAAVILAASGIMLMKNILTHEDMTYEDYLVHSGAMINEDYQDEITVVENDINEEDIIEYLIYTGVTAELIETSK